MNKRPTQCNLIIDYLTKNEEISAADAITELGVYRLASRISELKKQGYIINSSFVTKLNRRKEKVSFKVYSLSKEVIYGFINSRYFSI